MEPVLQTRWPPHHLQYEAAKQLMSVAVMGGIEMTLQQPFTAWGLLSVVSNCLHEHTTPQAGLPEALSSVETLTFMEKSLESFGYGCLRLVCMTLEKGASSLSKTMTTEAQSLQPHPG